MPIDPSIALAPANALAKLPTPMQQISEFANTQNALNQNQQFQRNFAAQQAVGQSIQAAIDPRTGQLDPARAAVILSQTPAAAPLAQDAINKLYDNKIQQMNLNGSQIDQVLKTTSAFTAKMQGVAAIAAKENRAVNLQDITGAATDLYSSGLFGAPGSEQAKSQITNLVSGIPADPAGQHQWFLRHLVDTSNTTAALERVSGVPVAADTGNGTVFGNQDPNTGAVTPRTTVTKGLPATELYGRQVVGHQADGTPIYGSGSQVAAGLGAPNGGAGGQVTQLGGGAPGGQAPVFAGGGNYPSPFAGAGAPAPAGAAPAGPPPTMNANPAAAPAAVAPRTYGMGAPQLNAIGASDIRGTGQYNDELQAAADPAPLNNAQHALNLLTALGPTGTGAGSQGINTFKSYLGQIFGSSSVLNSVANYDEANKYLTQMAQSQPGASHSADALAASFSGNPSTRISNAASIDVLKTNIALMRQRRAAVLSYQASNGQQDTAGTGFPSYAAQFTAHADPRAYGFDMMTPQQRQQVLSSLAPAGASDAAKTAAKAKFYGQVQGAIDAGLMPPPSSSSAGGQ